MVSTGPIVQVFGRDDSQATRRCLRFFRERRMPLSFVDMARRPMAPAELRRFRQHFGARALLDESGKAYRDAGLAWLRLGDDELEQRLLAESRENLGKRLEWVDKQLAGKQYLMGDAFTVADAYLFTVLRWSGRVKLDLRVRTRTSRPIWRGSRRVPRCRKR